MLALFLLLFLLALFLLTLFLLLSLSLSSTLVVNIGPALSSVISGEDDDGEFNIPNSFNNLLFNFNSSNLIDLIDSAGASSVSIGPNPYSSLLKSLFNKISFVTGCSIPVSVFV